MAAVTFPEGSTLRSLKASRVLTGSTSGSGWYPSARSTRLVSAGRGNTSGSARCPSAFRAPPLDAAQHFGASRLVSAGRGSTSGSGWYPSAFRGPPPCGSFLLAGAALQALDGTRAHFEAPSLDAARRSTWEPRSWFLLAGATIQALDGTRARFGAPPLDAARRSTFEPRGWFLLAGAALQALDGARARFGAPLLMLPGAALGSLAARFCWQGQHFRLWTVPERVSGPSLDAARRSTWEPRGSFLLAEAALQALDGTRALQALDGTRARIGAPLLMQHLGASRLVSAGRGSTSGSGRYNSAFRGALDAARRSTWFGPPPP